MEHEAEVVVLLHGIGRTRMSMRPLERVVLADGYRTINLSYPSRRLSLEDIADWLARRLNAEGVWEAPQVHFVTHSMGGLVVARTLAVHGDRGRIGRVVMLAPPSQGSEVADALVDLPPYRWLFGPAGQQLTTSARAGAMAPYYDLGIIAGTSGEGYLLGRLLLPTPHDGRVSVEGTRMPGMRDHLVVRASHRFIMRKADVQRQVVAFLRNGQFER